MIKRKILTRRELLSGRAAYQTEDEEYCIICPQSDFLRAEQITIYIDTEEDVINGYPSHNKLNPTRGRRDS